MGRICAITASDGVGPVTCAYMGAGVPRIMCNYGGGVPVRRVIVFWGVFWGPPVWETTMWVRMEL